MRKMFPPPKPKPIHTCKLDLNMDEKKLRRIISNRLSAHRSRIRTYEYVKSMENKVKALQDMISFLHPQVDSYKEKQQELLMQNASLQKIFAIHLNESKISEIELERKRVEIGRLKELMKATQKNSSDFDYGSQQMQGSRFNQSKLQPYSLEFYQKGLKKFVANRVFQGKQ